MSSARRAITSRMLGIAIWSLLRTFIRVLLALSVSLWRLLLLCSLQDAHRLWNRRPLRLLRLRINGVFSVLLAANLRIQILDKVVIVREGLSVFERDTAILECVMPVWFYLGGLEVSRWFVSCHHSQSSGVIVGGSLVVTANWRSILCSLFLD